MVEEKPIKIFISYAFEEGEKAGKLKEYLNWLGFECFLAHVDIKNGEIWRESIDEELNHSDAFVPLLTESALKSAWVHQESGIAHFLKRKKKNKFVIIPLCINNAPPPGCLEIYQARNLKEGWFFGVKITEEEARHIGLNIVEKLNRGSSHINYALENLTRAGISETEEILEFLEALGGITLDHLLIALKHGIERGAVAHSYRSMVIIEGWVKYYNEEVSPEWVTVWKKIKKKYQTIQEEEARRTAETAALIKASLENMNKPAENLNDNPLPETESQ